MRRDGFTLIEVLTASALLTAALGMIWAVWIGANDTAEALGRKANGTDAVVHAMANITRELRATSAAQLSDLPAEELFYHLPEDLDGNGLPADAHGVPEWGEVRRIGRDLGDANKDGFTVTQLVLEYEGGVEVLANDLLPPGSDAGHGIWFEAQDEGVLVTLAVSSTTRRKVAVGTRVEQRVTPRNP